VFASALTGFGLEALREAIAEHARARSNRAAAVPPHIDSHTLA
jgi:50S ribosomal subunit-associated GTPase HflX